MLYTTKCTVPDHNLAVLLGGSSEEDYHTLLRIVQQGHNLNLVGPAGSGKTQLLRAICLRPPYELPDAPLPVYLNLRPLAHATQEELLARLAEALIHALHRANLAKDARRAGPGISDLVSSQLLAILGRSPFRDMRVCYALDHFEYAACNMRLSTAFFGVLRSLYSQPDVSAICATRVPLWQFERLVSCASSTFPNVFLTWELSNGETL